MKSFISLLKDARLIIETCFETQPGDAVTILADADHMAEAEALAAAAHAIDAKPVIFNVTSMATLAKIHPAMPADPPKHMAAAMTNSDVIIIEVELEYAHRLAHTEAVRDSCKANARIASIEDGMGEWGLTKEDVLAIEERTKKLIEATRDAKWVHVTAPGGTDVTLSIEGRPPLKCTPIKKRGEMMNPIPLWGEVAWGPVEDKTEGKIVIDGYMCGIGLVGSLPKPIEWTMKNGRAVNISGDENAEKLKTVLSKSDENANVVGEFAIGTSPFEGFGTPSEQGKLGTVHFALGDNLSYPGGRNKSKTHFDGTVRNVTIEVDGRLIIKDGKIVI
ncbi:MAG: hypothetical protein DRG83_07270 [Deltaproteobacteria bacterium]|nr:MAG: hypothetical protein DRG83_07270 [Deltaproteobacteria bacterium]